MEYREARRIIEVSKPYRIPCVKGVSSETDFGSLATLHFRAAIRTLDGFPAENSFYLKLNGVPIGWPAKIVKEFVELSDKSEFGAAPSREALQM